MYKKVDEGQSYYVWLRSFQIKTIYQYFYAAAWDFVLIDAAVVCTKELHEWCNHSFFAFSTKNTILQPSYDYLIDENWWQYLGEKQYLIYLMLKNILRVTIMEWPL